MKREKLPDFFIEQKALSELDNQYEGYFTEQPELMEKVNALGEDNRKILDSYPPEKMAALIRARMEKETKQEDTAPRKSNIIKFVSSPIPILAAAALALVIGIVPFLTHEETLEDPAFVEGTRLKGLKPQVMVFKETNGEAKELGERSLVREHDLLQIEYNAGDYPYGMLLSIDGRGVITLHFPYSEYDSQKLERGANARLPYAYELDDAPYYERFYFLFSKDTLPVGEILEQAESLAEESFGGFQVPGRKFHEINFVVIFHG